MATQQKPFRGERLFKDLSLKSVYYWVDEERDINQKCREVYKKADQIIHYPIGFRGGQKYKNTRRFIYRGFKNSLPVGAQKSPRKGLGFTKVLRPVMDYLEKNMIVEEIIVEKAGKSKLDSERKTLTLCESDLVRMHSTLNTTLSRHRNENELLAAEQLHLLFPKNVKKGKRKYVKNSIASALMSWGQAIKELSETDKSAVRDLFDKLSLTDGFLKTDVLLKTKSKLDEQYIEDVIGHFEKLMSRKTETRKLEKEWQALFKKHSWIFSYIFSFPIILLQDEAYVGGKNLSNKDGKVTDFIVKNDLTNNVAFIEIKTHKTDLIKKGSAYRGSDVYSISSSLSGGISQVLNQRDNFQKEFAVHKLKSDLLFETFNSKCVVLMGSLRDLGSKQMSSFELFRSNSKDVDILTFDELLQRFKKLKELIEKSSSKESTKLKRRSLNG